jgi:hypothetical protein
MIYIYITAGFIDSLQSYMDNPAGQLSAYSLRWQHENTFLRAVADRVGSLDVAVIEKLNRYFDMIEQSKAFRQNLRESLALNRGNVRKSHKELAAYILALKSEIEVAKELLAVIKKSYG